MTQALSGLDKVTKQHAGASALPLKHTHAHARTRAHTHTQSILPGVAKCTVLQVLDAACPYGKTGDSEWHFASVPAVASQATLSFIQVRVFSCPPNTHTSEM